VRSVRTGSSGNDGLSAQRQRGEGPEESQRRFQARHGHRVAIVANAASWMAMLHAGSQRALRSLRAFAVAVLHRKGKVTVATVAGRSRHSSSCGPSNHREAKRAPCRCVHAHAHAASGRCCTVRQ
jgi:hypothetical protein